MKNMIIILVLLSIGVVIALVFLLMKNITVKDARKIRSILKLAGLIIFFGLLMALMGYMISTGFRSALEVMHIS